MNLSEKERTMLETERDTIKRLTSEIIELAYNPENRVKLKQNVVNIQFSISRIASYADSKGNLNSITIIADKVLRLLNSNPPDEVKEAIGELIHNPSEADKKEIEKRLNVKYDKLWNPPENQSYPAWWSFAVDWLDTYCCYVNSITFEFTKEKFKIKLPKIDIKELNIFRF
jgi:hypothetical protein